MCWVLGSYPVTALALECWVRQRVKWWLEHHQAIETMGNETEVLNDLNVELRGPLLDLTALCFGIFLRVRYDWAGLPDGDDEEAYGDSNAKCELLIEYHEDGFVSGTMTDRDA